MGVTGFDEGDIRVVGQSVRTDALACKRVCAYVPDNPDVYEFLTGIQYLNYISDVFEVPADVTRRSASAAYADRLGLTSALGDLVSSYSHGMRQSSCSSARSCTTPRFSCWTSRSWGSTPRRRST